MAAEHEVGVIDFDDPVVREAVAADPATFVSGSPPVCIIAAPIDTLWTDPGTAASPNRPPTTGAGSVT